MTFDIDLNGLFLLILDIYIYIIIKKNTFENFEDVYLKNVYILKMYTLKMYILG